ncbi:MAG: glutaconate CoA-transferase [Gemmatimonadetes bacterium]|nr:glutaconate CoA-transferase [Gemmatimonadota bacterium]
MDDDVTTGRGPLFSDPDPDRARAFFRSKRVALSEKVMSVDQAVSTFVHDGDYLASGGFGTNRIATALLHEVLRQEKRGLSFAGHTTTHDFEILCAGHVRGPLLARVDAAYIVGLEARGLSPQARRVMQSGDVEVCEWSNYALAVRLRAAATGVPFLPMRSTQGTDTFRFSASKTVECPFTGRPLAAVPALYPDVAFIHVHTCDPLGNARVEGISVADADLARASKRVILTTEKIVSVDQTRESPQQTLIPSACVDAVCEVPYGSYPGNMPGCYFSDEVHLREWLAVERDPNELTAFVDRLIYETDSFQDYLEASGATHRLAELEAIEKGG